jgi:multiple sugar transport system substrate-binding protein
MKKLMKKMNKKSNGGRTNSLSKSLFNSTIFEEIIMKKLRKTMINMIALCTTLICFAGVVEAKTTITCLTIASHLEKQHKPLAEKFNAMQEDIKVVYAAPAKDYSDTHLKMLRASATNTLPDCVFSAYNQLPPLSEALNARGQIVDLGPLMEAEGEGWTEANYTSGMLEPGQVDGVQWSIPFNASIIQWYYNADLFKQAGLNPDNFPLTWYGLIDAAIKIKELDDDILGLSYGADFWGDDWLWQALITSQGGKMVSGDRKDILFDEDNLHINAMQILSVLVTSGAYDNSLDGSTQNTAFTEGKMGMFASSPSGATWYAGRVGGAFELRSAPFTIINDENGYLPVGGNVAVITTTDPEKIKATWEYIKYATGPEGQLFVSQVTGYLPTNKQALGKNYMGDFYDKNPLYATPRNQYHRVGPYAGYKGTQSEKIWRDQRATISQVMNRKLSVEEGAAKTVSIAEELMQR